MAELAEMLSEMTLEKVRPCTYTHARMFSHRRGEFYHRCIIPYLAQFD